MKEDKIMKRILASTVCFALIFSCTGAFAAEGDENAISEMRQYEIFIGDEGGNLNLDKNLTRGEMLKAVVCALGYEPEMEIGAAEHWAQKYADAADVYGITDGAAEDLDEYVTYAEALRSVIRALGYDVNASALGGYPAGYMQLASQEQLGLIEGGISPDDTILRGDFLNILHKALDTNLLEQMQIVLSADGTQGATWRVSDETLRSKYLETK